MPLSSLSGSNIFYTLHCIIDADIFWVSAYGSSEFYLLELRSAEFGVFVAELSLRRLAYLIIEILINTIFLKSNNFLQS